MREGSLTTDHYYSFAIEPYTAGQIVSMISDAYSSRKRLEVVGDAASCPTSSGERSGGTITSSNYIETL
jgi:hypothetical protein